MECRLPGAVATSHHHDRCAGAHAHLGVGGGVVDARSFEFGQSLEIEASVVRSRCDDQRSTADHRSVAELDDEVPSTVTA